MQGKDTSPEKVIQNYISNNVRGYTNDDENNNNRPYSALCSRPKSAISRDGKSSIKEPKT